MLYRESKNFLTSDNIDFIEKTILGNNFPLYQMPHTVSDNYQDTLTHIILTRPEDSFTPRIRSAYYDPVINIIKSFFKLISLRIFILYFFLKVVNDFRTQEIRYEDN